MNPRITKGVLVAVLGVAICGCDSITGVKVDIHTEQPIDATCILKSREHLGPVSQIGKVPLDPHVKGELYMVRRDQARLEVTRHDEQPQTITLSFGWDGPPTEQEEKDNIRLLGDFERAVFEACSLNRETTRVTRACSGKRVCREAGIKE